jgi:hypothetical protein
LWFKRLGRLLWISSTTFPQQQIGNDCRNLLYYSQNEKTRSVLSSRLHFGNPQVNEQQKKPVKRYVFDDISSEYYAVFDEPQVVRSEKGSPRPPSPPGVDSQRSFVAKKEGPRFGIIDAFYFKPEEQSPAEPRAEFHSILHKLLELVKEVLFANTAVLFWVDKDRKLLAIADKMTNSSSFTKELRLPIGNDVISRIALSGKP